jgi:copper chaperone CopZ
MATVTYGVPGMTNSSCAAQVQSPLGAIPGVSSAHMDVAHASLVNQSASRSTNCGVRSQ